MAAYHTKCIDPWLTKNRRVCPVCKRKVFAADERVEDDSESDSDADDTTPLIRHDQTAGRGNGTQGGTFTTQTENPFWRQLARTRHQRQRRDSQASGTSYESADSGSASGHGAEGGVDGNNGDQQQHHTCRRADVEIDGGNRGGGGEPAPRNMVFMVSDSHSINGGSDDLLKAGTFIFFLVSVLFFMGDEDKVLYK